VSEPRHHRVPVDGGELAVAVWDGDAPVVLAIHGGMSSFRAWTTIVADLGGRATVIAPDYRGGAGSTDVGPPYGLLAHADDMRRVLDHFDVESAVVTGWSLGGFIAANAAELLGDRARALVLVDGGLPLALPEGFDVDAAEDSLFEPLLERYRQRFTSREEHRAYWKANPAMAGPGLWDDTVQAHFDDELAETDDGLEWRVNLESLRVDVLDTLRGDTRTAVERVRCPIGFVWAERGLVDEPVGYYTLETVHRWRDELGMHVVEGFDQNHYTLMLRDDGAALVAGELSRALDG
jgi:pimeloyl-ACP methyl ester carboxylesterase